jgi:predicted secreted Zn-dependent protease
MNKKGIEIETTADLQMNIQTVKTKTIIPENGKSETEIAFTIHGYDSEVDEEVLAFATITKKEAKKLAKHLLSLASDPELNSMGIPKAISRDPNHPKVIKLRNRLRKDMNYGK